jgi:hypothetical protein
MSSPSFQVISILLNKLDFEDCYPGDSLPYPKVTKEELDYELDQIQKERAEAI